MGRYDLTDFEWRVHLSFVDTYGAPTTEHAPSQIPGERHRRPTSEAYCQADNFARASVI